MSKNKYYSLKKILEKDAQYNLIISGRSNGKTFACHEYALKKFWDSGCLEQCAYIRRWSDDFTGKRGNTLFDAQVSSGNISKLTGGEWTNIYYYASKWYLARFEDDKLIHMKRPFCYGFSISAMEHDKSTSYPDVTTIIFDEFISRGAYLTDEFVLFMNVCSTIIRNRNNVKIFMLGNTVNKYCPYFNEMGLKHIKDMTEGTIDVYTYGNSDLRVAVEYAINKAGKDSAIYFCFDNPKMQAITGQLWEFDIYPHLPIKYKPKDILYTFFICFDSDILQCEIITVEDVTFCYIHRKTTPLKATDRDLIYTPEYSPRYNYHRNILKPNTSMTKKIAALINQEKIFYQSNDIGEIMRNYLLWCRKSV